MALYINERQHPDVYKSCLNRIEPNQNSFKTNDITELLKEQKKENDKLQNSFLNLEQRFKKTEQSLFRQSDRIGNQFDKLEELDSRHAMFENSISTWSEKIIDENNAQQQILSNSLLVEKDLADKIDIATQKNIEIRNELDDQSNTQRKIAKQLLEQEVKQVEVVKRLENQEVLMGKVLRQIDYYKSILFERTQFFAGKIEQGYTNSTSYVSRLVKGRDRNVKDKEMKDH